MQEPFLLRDFVIGLLILVMTEYALYQCWIMYKMRHRAATLSVPAACLTISLAAAFLVDGVSPALGEWTGANNLGWYLGYTFGVIGLYQFGYMACQTDLHPYGPVIERCLRVGMMTLLALMGIIYVVYQQFQIRDLALKIASFGAN